ncbi:ribonuclease III, partial [Patescibacteria group bacterium]|nr:ribonuclease III [Patescibacteria group bacterium]
MTKKTIKQIEGKLGVEFTNSTLLENAFIHRSFLNESSQEQLSSNERLEFLGDAVLELVVSQLLYEKLPDYPEGKLTNIRSLLVRTTTLAELTDKLNVGNHLLLSKGEAELGGRHNISLLANLFEAVVGAIYLDRGLKAARNFIIPLIKERFERVIQTQSFKDAKSLFQEAVQEKDKITPEYRVLAEAGPDHSKTFTVGLWVG